MHTPVLCRNAPSLHGGLCALKLQDKNNNSNSSKNNLKDTPNQQNKIHQPTNQPNAFFS